MQVQKGRRMGRSRRAQPAEMPCQEAADGAMVPQDAVHVWRVAQ
jgi:hypothetical protein